MFNFTFYAPTRVIFGHKTEEKTGEAVRRAGGKKVLLHYGGQSAERSGLLDQVRASLDAAEIDYVELGGVVPNPHLSKVREGIELCLESGVDFILAVGGGSVIDSAKAIGYALAEPDKDVWDLYEHVRKAEGCYPIGAVLTIAAAGSEMSDSSVITDTDTGKKRSYESDLCRPKFAIMDPELTVTLPEYQTEAGCVDIMMHTMERYFTQGGNMEITDGMAEALLHTVMRNALILKDDPTNYDARAEVMWSSSLSHNNLMGCGNYGGGDYSTHMLEHELGGKYDVTHGAGIAAVYGSWARYVYRDCLPRFKKFAIDVMGVAPEGTDEEIAVKGIEAMEDFYRSIDMPTSLSELGVEPTDEDLRDMARRCAETCGGEQGTAKVLHEEDMYEIYRMANH